MIEPTVSAPISRVSNSVPRRVVLLGASNLTKGLATIIETAARIWGRPLQVLATPGHGRSYGQPSSVLGRQLPGISKCGLWRALRACPSAETAALVTDIGNDLLYEAPVDRIVEWLQRCLDRLAEVHAQTVVTLLPTDNLAALSPRRFRYLQRALFPRCGLSLDTIARRANELNERVRALAVARRMKLAEQRMAWYGIDPVHIRWLQRRHAWREILARWSADAELPPPTSLFSLRTLYLRALTPEQRRWFGWEQRSQQPAGRLRDGTTIALY